MAQGNSLLALEVATIEMLANKRAEEELMLSVKVGKAFERPARSQVRLSTVFQRVPWGFSFATWTANLSTLGSCGKISDHVPNGFQSCSQRRFGVGMNRAVSTEYIAPCSRWLNFSCV